MSKSYVQVLSKVWRAILADARYAYPALGVEFDRDQAHIDRATESIGLPLFAAYLPNLAKHLDRCLAEGQYKPSGLPFSKRLPHGGQIPVFLRGLYLLIFNRDGSLKQDRDTQAVFFLRQLLLVGKKVAVPCGTTKVAKEVATFLALDASLPLPEEIWEEVAPPLEKWGRTYTGFARSALIAERTGETLSKRQVSSLLTTLDVVSGIVSSVLGPYRPEEWSFRHGPGVVSDKTAGENKYNLTLWPSRLEPVFPFADCAKHSYSEWAGYVDGYSMPTGEEDREVPEPASKLIDVPKTFDKPRLIAAEPSAHMWCQQNLWHYFETRVRSSWLGEFVKFRDQTQNQELCLRASKDGSLATVDLSAASDRVTCHVVGQLFRGNPGLLSALQASRTRFITQDQVRSAPDKVMLRKYSTMGNATTFPVESLVFLSLVLTAVLVKHRLAPTVRNIKSLIGKVSVFGDDIIVPADCREELEWLLEVAYFKVNTNKSFWTGMFRESCGVDAYMGEVVTPVYWHEPAEPDLPGSIVSTIATANNFYQRFLVVAAACLDSTIPAVVHLPLVQIGSAVEGRHSFVAPYTPGPFKTRYNGKLQREEIRLTCFIARQTKSPIQDSSALLQFFTELPQPHDKWSSGIPQRPEVKFLRQWVPVQQLCAQRS